MNTHTNIFPYFPYFITSGHTYQCVHPSIQNIDTDDSMCSSSYQILSSMTKNHRPHSLCNPYGASNYSAFHLSHHIQLNILGGHGPTEDLTT